jgi:hypothetical protein
MTLQELMEFWRDISLKHKDVKGFVVGNNYDMAVSGNKYPEIFWELPYSINTPDWDKPKDVVNVSFCIYLSTKLDDIADSHQAISLAKEIGDAIITKVKQEAGNYFTVDAVNCISVREYSDDYVAGMRYDLTITLIKTMQPLCVDIDSLFNG